MRSNEKSLRFRRLAEKRANKVIDAIEVLGNCSNRQYYEFSQDEVSEMFARIHEVLIGVESSFSEKSRDGFRFSTQNRDSKEGLDSTDSLPEPHTRSGPHHEAVVPTVLTRDTYVEYLLSTLGKHGITAERDDRFGRSSYRLGNGKFIYVRFSQGADYGYTQYFFGLDPRVLSYSDSDSAYVLFTGGNQQHVFVVPFKEISRRLRNSRPARDGNFRIHIRDSADGFCFTGDSEGSCLTEYINNFSQLK